MKKTISTFAVLVMLSSLFAGCGKKDETAASAPETPKKVDDHAGHDHGDHSGHAH